MKYYNEGKSLFLVWVAVAALAAVQIACALELAEMSSILKKVASIDEKTAALKNEAAVLELETERSRNNYYRILSTSPFKLTEEEARGIIRSGVRPQEKGD